jgi:hypothetical protein
MRERAESGGYTRTFGNKEELRINYTVPKRLVGEPRRNDFGNFTVTSDLL